MGTRDDVCGNACDDSHNDACNDASVVALDDACDDAPDGACDDACDDASDHAQDDDTYVACDVACMVDSTNTKGELTVGEVAKRSGLAVSAIHFYESRGLIKSRRSPGNHRLYPREILRRIAVIKVAQKTGLSLEEIHHALKTLPDGRTPTKADWSRMSEAWKADLEDRIARLVRLRDHLDRCIGCGCLSISDCPLRNPDDQLGEEGPGPRLLDPEPPRLASSIKSAFGSKPE